MGISSLRSEKNGQKKTNAIGTPNDHESSGDHHSSFLFHNASGNYHGLLGNKRLGLSGMCKLTKPSFIMFMISFFYFAYLYAMGVFQ